MELVDLERDRAPAGGDALDRPPQGFCDLTKRTAPVRAPGLRKLAGLFDRRDRIGEKGFSFGHWDHLIDVQLWIGMDLRVLCSNLG